MIEAVFFDIGSTLMYASPSVEEMFTLVANERGHVVDLRDVERYMPEAKALYDAAYEADGDFWCSHERSTQVWKSMYRLLAERMGLAEDAVGISEAVHARYRDRGGWALYDDALACLDALAARGYRLGVISNWDCGLEALLDDMGMLRYFDVVISSAAEHCRKPHPDIFLRALERMGVAAERAVHVGDLPEADGAAAQVGITPVIVDRRRRWEGCPFARIESLLALPALLDSWAAGSTVAADTAR